MLYFVFAHIFPLFVDLFAVRRMSDRQKDIQILLLRQQLRILHRKHSRLPRISHWEKCSLAVLVAHLKELTKGTSKQLDETLLLFKPDTVLKWHRELVRRKWTYQHKSSRLGGRPCIVPELEELIVRLARENQRWGYSKIQGELLKLGYSIGRSTIRHVLKRNHIPPTTQRTKNGSNWRTFLGHYASQILACDFFTVGTMRLHTLHVLFFIELGTRRVHLAGCTYHPTSEWVTQQARNLSWDLWDIWDTKDTQHSELPMCFLIHDRDAKFTCSFDTVFKSESIEIIRTPYRAPNANAFAERWVRTIREECLDQLVIISAGHLKRVLLEYVEYYNRRRPHQGISQKIPVPLHWDVGYTRGSVQRRDMLGGIVT